MPSATRTKPPTADQLPLRLKTTWGGKRDGAGRPRLARLRSVAHRARPEHKPRFPVHVTLRGRRGLPSFRSERLFEGIRKAIAAASRGSFQVVHFSVQSDHLHLLVEAEDTVTLSSGAQGLAVRAARAINKVIGRQGAVWGDRYHARALSTPREVRHGLVYVLMNVKKHRPGWQGLDPRSSAAWFDGFHDSQLAPDPHPPPVKPARTWLATRGWRFHGLISVRETPRVSPPAVRRVGRARSSS
jgi:REP element-mobilizing transposase RayT